MARRVQWRRGTSAEHDAFTGAQAEITVDTDKGWLRVHDGATPGGSVINPQFNIQRFGAREGATPAVNAAAIQEATEAAHDASTGYYTRGGGTVLVPPGIFSVDESLIPRAKVDYVGVHPRASIIKAVGPIWAFERVEAGDIRLMGSFRDIGIWGDGDEAGVPEDGEALGGIHLARCHYSTFENVEFRNFSAAGAVGLSLGRVYWWRASGIFAEFCHTACVNLYAIDSVGSNMGEIVGRSELIGNSMADCQALVADGAQGLRIRNTDFEGSGNGLRGIALTGCDSVSIKDCYIELWTGNAITLAGGGNNRITINHSVINGTTGGGDLNVIDLDTAGTPNKRIRIHHNRFADVGVTRTCVRVGNATKVLTYDNDPDTGIMLDQRAGSFDNTLVSALVATATWDPADTASGALAVTNVTVTGAKVGDPVSVSFYHTGTDNVLFHGRVTADDTVRVSMHNMEAGNTNLPSGTLKVIVFKQGI